MAFLKTEAAAASRGLYGEGGCGYISTHWHKMPDAEVKQLESDDCRGDIEIRWKLDNLEGVLADLWIGEARTLRDKLTAAIDAFDGTDNEVGDTELVNDDESVSELSITPMRCGACGELIEWIECPTGSWWAHKVHPGDHHDAILVWVSDTSSDPEEVA
ncbi:hypothetical protein [Nocardia sp. NPDC020380]|uniref:hypothetical protein n=1 Tax=Nocardia sp. NPDC020380 TaxID=3364309 RepID=UPI003790CF3C